MLAITGTGLQLRRDPAIAIPAVRQRCTLHYIAHSGFFLGWSECSPLPVITSTAHSCQQAQSLDRELALRTR